jgi:hypothetical protein
MRSSIILRLKNYVDCHPEEKCHRFEYCLTFLYNNYFECPIWNQVGYFVDHVFHVFEILESMLDNPFYHFALFTFQVVRNLVSPFLWFSLIILTAHWSESCNSASSRIDINLIVVIWLATKWDVNEPRYRGNFCHSCNAPLLQSILSIYEIPNLKGIRYINLVYRRNRWVKYTEHYCGFIIWNSYN